MNRWPAALMVLAVSAVAQAATPKNPVETTFTSNEPSTNLAASAIIARALANRPMQDLALKGRLFLTRDDKVPIEVFIRNTPTETRTIYRSDKMNLLVVQPLRGATQFYLRGVGQLSKARQIENLLGSEFTLYDIGFPFMHWTNFTLLGDDRVRGRDCYRLEAKASNTNSPYAKVILWIDHDYFGLVRADGYDAEGALVKRFAITSLKRIGDVWIPRGIEAARVPPGQAMPAEVRSRLEFYDGNYNAKLPADLFSEEQFKASNP